MARTRSEIEPVTGIGSGILGGKSTNAGKSNLH